VRSRGANATNKAKHSAIRVGYGPYAYLADTAAAKHSAIKQAARGKQARLAKRIGIAQYQP